MPSLVTSRSRSSIGRLGGYAYVPFSLCYRQHESKILRSFEIGESIRKVLISHEAKITEVCSRTKGFAAEYLRGESHPNPSNNPDCRQRESQGSYSQKSISSGNRKQDTLNLHQRETMSKKRGWLARFPVLPHKLTCITFRCSSRTSPRIFGSFRSYGRVKNKCQDFQSFTFYG
jgi:hypothetical protein